MHSANEHCSYTEVEDNSSKGKVINVSVGRGTAGSFSIKGFLGSAGGSVSMSGATDIVKCGPGNKPWTLVRFALNPNAYQVDGHDREFLQILGFTLKQVLVSRLRLTKDLSFTVVVRSVACSPIPWTTGR